MLRFFCCVWFVCAAGCSGDGFDCKGPDDRPNGFELFAADNGPDIDIYAFFDGINGSFCIGLLEIFAGSAFFWAFFLKTSSSSSSDPPKSPFFA
jgi:hypothetical protein